MTILGATVHDVNEIELLKLKIKRTAIELFTTCLQLNDCDAGFEASFTLAGYVDWVEFRAKAGDLNLYFSHIRLGHYSNRADNAIKELKRNFFILSMAKPQLLEMHKRWLKEKAHDMA